MGITIDIKDKKFGRLTALSLDHIEKSYKRTQHFWLCKCECGNKIVALKSNLTTGHTKSCGCYERELTSKRSKIINKTHGKSEVRIYKNLQGMIQRCHNNKTANYKNYGGRGIKVCVEWLDKENGFMNFYNWAMLNGYKDNLTIDRIDNNGNYEPSNCRWIDMQSQNENTRSNINFTYNGETHCLTAWAKIRNIKINTVYNRYYHLKWSVEETLEFIKKTKKEKYAKSV